MSRRWTKSQCDVAVCNGFTVCIWKGFTSDVLLNACPTTRYQGSKRKLLPWIWEQLQPLEFHTALDAFGGTASVAYLLKTQGKAVTANDYLAYNVLTARAVIENSQVRLSPAECDFVCTRQPGVDYDDLIARSFSGIYFTDEENAWLDAACQNIRQLPGVYQQALAFHALGQACLRKRPYNLFHRCNLSMRTADVARSFGNKATWESPFPTQFLHFAHEAEVAVFDSGVACRAVRGDALDVPGEYDLVYIDPPYINGQGVGVDYFAFYHFLEGMVDYGTWEPRIDMSRKHRPLLGCRSPWSDPQQIGSALTRLLERHSGSTLVISYRSDGNPSETELVEMLKRYKRQVTCIHYGAYQYALSTNRRSRELLLIGRS